MINFFTRERWKLLQPLQQPGRSTYRRLVYAHQPGQRPALGLSHLSFYDTGGGGQVPEPTTLLLLGAGLFAAGFARRRVKHN